MIASQTDLLVQHSRRQLWIALVLVAVLGIAALLVLGFPGKGADTGQALLFMYPEIVAGALLSLRRSKRQAGKASAARVQAVVNDELRQHSLNLAFRNAFFVMLLAQPLLGAAVSWSGTPHPLALLAGASTLAGVIAALGSMLWYDR